MVSLHGNGTDPEQAEIERLGLRLARLEALVGKAAVSSQSQGLSRTKSLWADVIQTAGKLGEVITKMGDTVLLHQLEKDVLLSKDVSGPPSLRSASAADKEAVVLAREGEVQDAVACLRSIQAMQQYINGPFLQDAGALRGELSGVEARFVSSQRQAQAISQDLDQLLSTYDQAVSMLSLKCIEWDEALARLEQPNTN